MSSEVTTNTGGLWPRLAPPKTVWIFERFFRPIQIEGQRDWTTRGGEVQRENTSPCEIRRAPRAARAAEPAMDALFAWFQGLGSEASPLQVHEVAPATAAGAAGAGAEGAACLERRGC